MADDKTLCWEIGIPLVNNPTVMRAVVWVSVLSSLGPGVLLGLLIGAEEGWEAGFSVLGIFALVGLGLFVVFLLIMLLVFGNRFQTRFTIDDKGVIQETIDWRAKAANTLGSVAGAATRNPQVLGSSLLARGQQVVELHWSGAFRAVPHARRHSITLRNSWRPLLEIQCHAENYPQVLARVEELLTRHGTHQRVPKRSMLPTALGRTALLLLASAPVFALQEVSDLDLFVPMLMVAFALATVWLIPLFGWVVLAANGYIVFQVVVDLFTRQPSYLFPGRSYLGYEVLSGNDQSILLLALLGLGYLSWLSWRAVRGRLMPMLMMDMEDMG